MTNENTQNDKDRENKLEIAELNNDTDLEIARMKSHSDSQKVDATIETANLKDRTDKEKVKQNRESTASNERISAHDNMSKATQIDADNKNAKADRESAAKEGDKDRQSNEKISKDKPNPSTE